MHTTAQVAYDLAQQEAQTHIAEAARRQTIWQTITAYGDTAIDSVCEWALGQGITEKQIRLWFYSQPYVIVEVEAYKIHLDLDGRVALEKAIPTALGGTPPSFLPSGMPGSPPREASSPSTLQSDKQYGGLPGLSDGAVQTFWDSAISALAADLSKTIVELTSDQE